ncbi:heavy metal translocating P-type ATPase [Pedobacter metabolipauper]|uniref:P-type Zn(2+) transporter n=1 Tax=Pedobacter metabolipauper TaxID=425513 RepID=A0A4R6SU87_9SPHI|nr:heavy metal translocating P-type ATPase [Pedobacter metabolipauper]TDQ08588.1 Cd2+/Zn2+-exporting ATPase [Pedobacter metabolipauper]
MKKQSDCCGNQDAAEEIKKHAEHHHNPDDHENDDHDHDHGDSEDTSWLNHWPLITALVILIVMQVLELGFKITIPKIQGLIIYGSAYLLAGYNVLYLAYKKAIRLDFFNEFFLMSVATAGAFAIGSYSEGVAVMVFYSIGEWFQDTAVSNAKRSIKALLDIRPESVNVVREGKTLNVPPSEIQIEEVIEVKPGEKVALDGVLFSDKATFNTAALTGESRPDSKAKGEIVLAGMINLNQLAQIKVTALFKDSKLSKILEMVQDATARKSQTQLFISRFAKVYTPLVFLLAVLVVLVPYFFVPDYIFKDWLYRGLVFLVISCPCALVVSIPLGYFGGIGLASKNGILFKGSNFLDVITKIDTVVMDKTGTLTKGVFKVQKVITKNYEEKELVSLAAALESKSTHPIATAIIQYAENLSDTANLSETAISDLEEIAGHGLKGIIDGKVILAGNTSLFKKFNISYEQAVDEIEDTVVLIAVDQQYAGYLVIADEIKEDAKQAIADLHALAIKTVMLSGDRESVVSRVATILGIESAFGDLLPENKVAHVEGLKKSGRRIAFIGDGVNDAPVVALADAGIAMGGLGSDATIETADIVIQNDQPSKIVTAIKIGKITRSIVWQNIAFALIVKVLVLILGAGGIATLWEAVIADVGVALLAILNAVRIQRIKF